LHIKIEKASLKHKHKSFVTYQLRNEPD